MMNLLPTGASPATLVAGGVALVGLLIAMQANRLLGRQNALLVDQNGLSRTQNNAIDKQTALVQVQTRVLEDTLALEQMRRLNELRQILTGVESGDGVSSTAANVAMAAVTSSRQRSEALEAYVELERSLRPDRIVNLSKARLENVDIGGVDLSNINFTDAHFEGAVFRGTDLSGSTFCGAHMAGAEFLAANLGGTNFRGALSIETIKLRGANLFGSWIDRDVATDTTAFMFWPEAAGEGWLGGRELMQFDDDRVDRFLAEMKGDKKASGGVAGLRIFRVNHAVLECLRRFQSVERLIIVDQQLTDAQIRQVASSVSTRSLTIVSDSDLVTDAVFDHLGQFRALEKLTIDARITDAGVTKVAQLESLLSFRVHSPNILAKTMQALELSNADLSVTPLPATRSPDFTSPFD